ncbi:site-specific recombinases, DNA invertase Pin homologs [Longilinea arvoryzae]|uniref:Site-specific recombinases, DNA invertase Pin homologs n=1 Tax=Longilinea arvoryzae TaxID=360412 RepID=A0A0S7BI68_9CHLR|nr:recombinase family protein [Longilinea arvoryzae]GAP13258.1 site-specific recombinases, DNA invertase Pin homologs [Longilinea arvoryzae]
MDIFPNSIDDLNKKIQGFVRDITRPESEEKAAIYTRVSRIDPRHHGYSMDIQPDRSEEYARSKGWDIYEIYADPAKTGRNSRRPSLQKMIGDIRAGRVTVVVVHRLDRLYRNLESLLKFIRMIKGYKVRLVSVTEQIDTDNWWGRLVLYVLGALAEMYIWQASARTREAKLERVMNGLSNASFRFGYCNGLCSTCKDPNGKDYCPLNGGIDRVESQRGRIPVPHPIEMHAVSLAAHLYGKGKSDLEIASDLNSHVFRLPGGSEVTFRTKGLPGQTLPGPFSRDNVRDIIRSPFYVGLVAHYPTRPLNMDDDVENPKRKGLQQPLRNKRQPQILQKGQHQAIYPYELWEQNMQLRQSKGIAPATKNRPKRDYLLTGVGRCWVCMEQAGTQASLRGSTGNTGTQYYRCATIHDKGKKGAQQDVFLEIGGETVLASSQSNAWNKLIESHSSTLRADKLEAQIYNSVGSLEVPSTWHEMIMAYYLSDHGMAEFERENYNLRQELKRLQDMYTSGFLTQAQFKDRATAITSELQKMQPSANAEVREIIPFLNEFALTWGKMTSREQRILLKVMYEAIYFDEQGTVRPVLVNAPFDKLLGVAA